MSRIWKPQKHAVRERRWNLPVKMICQKLLDKFVTIRTYQTTVTAVVSSTTEKVWYRPMADRDRCPKLVDKDFIIVII